MEEAAGLDHDHAGSAAIRMVIGQPEEGHVASLAGRLGGREGPPPRADTATFLGPLGGGFSCYRSAAQV